MSYWVIFLTGLTTGGISCVAMQGGLLASVIANQKGEEIAKGEKTLGQKDWLPVTLFLSTKLISHVILGFLLGWLGSKMELSLTMRLIFQGLAAVFMLATAANLLELHPIFRYVAFQPPKFLQRLVRNTSKSNAFFAPAFLGLMTVFIPCGVTQAMEVLAISSGNAMVGALIMFFFVLGTSPIFALVGMATAKLSEKFQKNFMKFAALSLVFLGLSSLNGILVVLDAPVTFQKATYPITYFFSEERLKDLAKSRGVAPQDGVQRLSIEITNNGYSPKKLTVRAGQPVELKLHSSETYSCASSFVLKAFNIQVQLAPTDTKIAQFTPTKPGRYQFTCSMGMYTGILEVI